MKNILFLLATVFCFSIPAQDFVWVKGSTTSSVAGTYGTQNVAAPANNPGGRHGCAKWTDAAGNLWLFGGEGYSTNTTLGWLNDLWKYNIATNEWTWIRGATGLNSTGAYGTLGTASATNEPGAREFPACWTDASGNFWMFGGDGFATTTTFGRLGDLWKYNPATNEWTWVHGFNAVAQNGIYGTLGSSSPSNAPGCRYGAAAWTDPSGDLWLYGGRGFAASGNQGYVNDLWRYKISSNQWAWVSGANVTNQFGTYGTLGTPSSANAPGGRFFPACWMDFYGNLYLFGGVGFAATATNDLNDFWKFDPLTNQWTWIGGSNGINAVGVYGIQGVAAPGNIPGSRLSSAYWTDATGNFWMFGGRGFATANAGELNDLFRYSPYTNMWTWVKGAAAEDQNGIYGTLGISAPANNPGGREYNTWWKDHTGKFWIFGGEGYDISNSVTFPNHMNDLWTFSSSCSTGSINASPGSMVCNGTNATLTAVNGGTATQWFTSETSAIVASGGPTISVPGITSNAPTTYSYYAEYVPNCIGPRASIIITVNPVPTLTAVAVHTLICKAMSNTTLMVSGASTYTWNTSSTNSSASFTVSPLITTTYVVTGANQYGCTDVTHISVAVVICDGLKEWKENDFQPSLYPNPNSGLFTIKLDTPFTLAEINIMNALGQRLSKQEIHSAETAIKCDLAKGIYYYEVKLDNTKKAVGKFIVE